MTGPEQKRINPYLRTAVYGVAIGLVGFVVVLIVWSDTPPGHSLAPVAETNRPAPLPDAGEFAEIEKLAETACRCERTQAGTAGTSRCWAEFEARTASFNPTLSLSPCAEDSQEAVCFRGENPTAPERCVSVRHGICSEAERAEVDAVWKRVNKGASTPEQKARARQLGDAEINRLMMRWEKGDRVAQRQWGGGCGG